jgi:hypothetical protein
MAISKEVSDANLAKLGDYNRGRIAVGGSSLENNLQLYAGFGGTSPGSQNRYYLELPDLSGHGEFMKTAVHDPKLQTGDPSATIYDAFRSWRTYHAVGNGEQVSFIAFAMANGSSFESAQKFFTHEGPKNRNTARITIVGHRAENFIHIGRVSSRPGNPQESDYDFWLPGNDPRLPMDPGEGYLITTYDGKGSKGSEDAWDPNYEDPWPILLHGNLEDNADMIWNAWDPETRAGLLGAEIDKDTGLVTLAVRSIHEGRA